MFGYFAGTVVTGVDHLESAALYLLVIDGPESRRSPGPGYRTQVQDEPGKVRGRGTRMDTALRDVKSRNGTTRCTLLQR